jgi:outer membrane protein TolC
VEVLRDAEERARTLVGQVRTLIEGGQRPASELKQVQANLAVRVAQGARIEIGLVTAREQLGVAIGLPGDQIRALPLPGDDFPAVAPADAASVPAIVWLVEEARQQRTDLHAFERRQRQAHVLRLQARDALQPQLNLRGSVGYAGLDEGTSFPRFFTGFTPAGLNASAGIALEWPTVNNEARGILGRRESVYQQVSLPRPPSSSARSPQTS